jgi:hypothetical protein
MERVGTSISEYNLTEYGQNSMINKYDTLRNWMFDTYHYCQANGTLLIPFYRFDCSDDDDSDSMQKAFLKMFLIPAQTLKDDTFVANDRMI